MIIIIVKVIAVSITLILVFIYSTLSKYNDITPFLVQGQDTQMI